jgi:hypothetical protein
MTENEINRAVQYVTASTSYGRDTVAEIVRTSLAELMALATSDHRFARDALFEYVCHWTIKKTGYSEPLVREVLAGAGRWLDEEYERLARQGPAMPRESNPPMS